MYGELGVAIVVPGGPDDQERTRDPSPSILHSLRMIVISASYRGLKRVMTVEDSRGSWAICTPVAKKLDMC